MTDIPNHQSPPEKIVNAGSVAIARCEMPVGTNGEPCGGECEVVFNHRNALVLACKSCHSCGPESITGLVAIARHSEVCQLLAAGRRLPRTKDGVAVVIGDTVFAHVEAFSGQGRTPLDIGVVKHTIIGVPEHPSDGPDDWTAYWAEPTHERAVFVDRSGDTPISECYSTREAAESARAGKGAG